MCNKNTRIYVHLSPKENVSYGELLRIVGHISAVPNVPGRGLYVSSFTFAIAARYSVGWTAALQHDSNGDLARLTLRSEQHNR